MALISCSVELAEGKRYDRFGFILPEQRLTVKINVIGTSGSGKTTLARRIADELAIPYIEMDKALLAPELAGHSR